MKKSFLLVLSLIVSALLLTSCSNVKKYSANDGTVIKLDGKTASEKPEGKPSKKVESIKAVFEIKAMGKFVAELYPDCAPETVANFASLVEEGFYDGLIFHRVIPGFVAQAGDGKDSKTAKPIKGEFLSNGYGDNTLKHERGTLSMARTQDKNSASSQFFICYDTAEHLDGEYAAFGKVVYGMESVDKIAQSAVDENDKPLIDVVIEKAYLISEEEYQKYK